MTDIIKQHIEELKSKHTELSQQIELNNKWHKKYRDDLRDLEILIAKLEQPND